MLCKDGQADPRMCPPAGMVPHPGGPPPHVDRGRKRRESQAALLRRQVAGLEVSPALAGAALFERCDSLKQEAAAAEKALAGGAAGGGGGGSSGGFAALGGLKRCYMSELLGAGEAVALPPPPPAGYDPRAALGAAMQLYEARGAHAGRPAAVASKLGSFVARPELAAVVAERT